MSTLQSVIAARLTADAMLTDPVPTGLGFGVHSHWLIPNGPGGTPSAFDTTRGNRLKRSIVVLDGGEVASPARSAAGLRRWESFPTLHVFGEAHATGKEAIQSAALRIEALVSSWQPVVAGQPVTLQTDAWLAIEDSDQFPGNVAKVIRLRATGSRQLVPA